MEDSEHGEGGKMGEDQNRRAELTLDPYDVLSEET